jgi:hypothetical protein
VGCANSAFCGSLGGDAVGAGEVRRQELSGSVQGGGRFVEHRVEGLEDVRDARGDVASSRRTSWVPAWMIRGGRPDRSAKTGLIRPAAGSCPAV